MEKQKLKQRKTLNCSKNALSWSGKHSTRRRETPYFAATFFERGYWRLTFSGDPHRSAFVNQT
jgi:hypothetical protein